MNLRKKIKRLSILKANIVFWESFFLFPLLILFLVVGFFSIFGCEKKAEKVKVPSFNLSQKAKHLTSLPSVIRVLLLGSDSRTESIEGRSDSIILVQIDREKKRISLISFPRDSRVYIPGYGYNKINSAMATGGPQLTKKTIENFTGLSIDYYAVTTFIGFKKIISNLDGVTVTLERPVHDRWAKAYLSAGRQRLGPFEALALARARHLGNGDFTRAFHQQVILKGLFAEHQPRASWSELLFYLPIIFKNCQTSITPWEAFLLLRAAAEIPPSSFEHLVLKGSTGSRGGVSYVFLDENFQEEVFARLKERKSLSDLANQQVR